MRNSIGVLGGGLAGWAAAIAAAQTPERVLLWQREGLPDLKRLARRWEHLPVEPSLWAERVGLPESTHPLARAAWTQGRAFLQGLLEVARRGETAAVQAYAQEAGIQWHPETPMTEIGPTTGGWTLWSEVAPPVDVARLILATGGGKNRAHHWLETRGHTVKPPFPAFGGLRSSDRRLARLSPLELPQAQIKSVTWGESEFPAPQRLLISTAGLSGPATAAFTYRQAEQLHEVVWKGQIVVSWTPRTTADWKADFAERERAHRRRCVAEDIPEGFPAKLWPRLVKAAKIGPKIRWPQLETGPRQALIGQLTHATISFEGRLPYREETGWRGGVPLAEVDVATLESRFCPQLYLAGGLLDIDGPPGGHMAALSLLTGWLAGASAAAV